MEPAGAAAVRPFAAPGPAARAWPWQLTPLAAQATGAWLIGLGGAACLIILGVSPVVALAAAGVAAAATAARVHGHLAAIRATLALTPARRRALAAAHTVALLVPGAVLASRYTGPVLALVLAAGAGVPCGILADRSLRKAEFDRLATGPVGATSVRQAAGIARDCERLLARPLEARARGFAELNLADSLAQSMQATGIQQRLDRALSLLRRISADPALEPGFTEMAAMAVMDVAGAHAALTDDLGTYEAAVREAEDTARRSGQFSAHLAARVERQRADLLHARAEVEIAAAATGTPGMAERARATITEALDTLETARLAGSPPNADWHLWRSGLLSQRAMLKMRYHLDSQIRGRLQAQRASLLAEREGSWDKALVGDFRRAFESESQARDLEAAQRRYQGLRAKIEALDGFGDAFRLAGFADITRAATSRPVVYITAANRGGLGLIVSGATVHAVHLPELTRAELAAQIEQYRQGLMWLRQKDKDHAPQWRVCVSDMITWLSAATKPLWTALERFGTVTIVPGGPLSLLPLHAAKDSTQPAIAFAPNAASWPPPDSSKQHTPDACSSSPPRHQISAPTTLTRKWLPSARTPPA